MSKKSYIAFLKAFGFSRVEKNSYADQYGLKVVFDGEQIKLELESGQLLRSSEDEMKITSEIVMFRGYCKNPGL